MDKDKAVCSICGTEVDAESDFCSKCGSEMVVDPDARFCPQCGQKLSDYSVYCDNCGAMASVASPNEEDNLKAGINPNLNMGVPIGGRPISHVGERPVMPVGGQPGVPVGERPVMPVGGQPVPPVVERPVIPVGERPMIPVRERPEPPVRERPLSPGRDRPEPPVRERSVSPDRGRPEPPDSGRPRPPDRGQTRPPDRGRPGPPDRGRPGPPGGKKEDKKNLIAKFKELPKPARIAIIVGIVALCILIIVGISALVSYARNITILPELPTIELPAEEEEEPTPAPTLEVRLLNNGFETREEEIYVGETVTLRVEIESDDPDLEIVWTVNNINVIDIDHISSDKMEVTVSGIGRGLGRLTVTVGDIERVCVIRVADVPLVRAESVTILRSGRPATGEKIWVDDIITLTIEIEPYDADEEIITWFSSNSRILEIVSTSNDSTEVTVKGVAPGEAVLSVLVGNAQAECRFVIEPNFIEVPHPYATGLGDFFRDADGVTTAYLSSVPGLEEQAVLAEIQGNNGRNSYRFFYIQNGNLRTFDLLNVNVVDNNRMFLSSNNHLVTGGVDGFDTFFNVHVFVDGNLRENEARLSEQMLEDGEYRCLLNNREITQAEYDALIRQYGLNRTVDRSDDTAKILAMTVIVDAPRN